jgi:hypothetical protein
MSDSPQHFTIAGRWADGFDEIFEGNEKFFADLILKFQDEARDKSRPWYQRTINGTVEMYLWNAAILHGVVGRLSQGYVDILRLGDSLTERSWAGVGKDVLRLLNVVPLVGLASRLSRLLLVVQEANTMTCTWVSTANALARTGQKLFVDLEALAKVTGADLKWIARVGTDLKAMDEPLFRTGLLQGLQKLGVEYKVLGPFSDFEALVKANPRGMMIVNIIADSKAGTFAHSLLAEARGGRVLFFDTDSKIYYGVSELQKVYTNLRPHTTMLPVFLPNTAFINVVRTVAPDALLQLSHSPMVNVFLPVVPALKAVPSPGTPPQGRTN